MRSEIRDKYTNVDTLTTTAQSPLDSKFCIFASLDPELLSSTASGTYNYVRSNKTRTPTPHAINLHPHTDIPRRHRSTTPPRHPPRHPPQPYPRSSTYTYTSCFPSTSSMPWILTIGVYRRSNCHTGRQPIIG